MIIKIIFFLFTITFFMPVINFHGVTLSDILLLILLIYSVTKKIKFNSFEKKYFKFLFYFITFYIVEEIIHFKINIDIAGTYLFVMDKISFIYFFILSYVLIFYFHRLKKESIARYLEISILINAVILPYVYMYINLGHYSKLTSLFLKPNQFAFFLISSPIILILINYLKANNIKTIKKINNFMLLFYLPMLATASKSGFLILTLIHIAIFLFSFRYFSILVKVIYILLFITLLMLFNPYSFNYFIHELVNYFPQFNRVVNFLLVSDTLQTTDSFRVINNINGIKAFMQYPLFGIGFGTDIFLSPTGHELHNSYIRIFACLGITGGLFFIIFNLSYIFLSKKILKTNIIIFLFSIITLYGFYHDVFTNRFYYILFILLFIVMDIKLQSKKDAKNS